MGLFDNIFREERTEYAPDLYVEDLEKVTFLVDGVEREFVGGTFRAVPFFVESHELATGRRLVVNNLPNADANTIQDLGRKTRGISFSAYLLGQDVFQQKQDLINAMELGGIGNLVHPYLGRFKAYGGDLSVSENETTKQYVRLGLTFVIVNDSITAKETGSRDALLASAVENSNNSILADFEKGFSVLDAANGVVDAAADAVDGAVNAVLDARQSIRDVALFVEKIKSIKENISFLLGAPGLLGRALLDLFTFEDEDNPDRDYKREQKESMNATAWASETPNTQTGAASDKQIQQNDAAINSLSKQGNAGQAAKITPQVAYDSVEDAGATIQALGEVFDDAQLAATSDGAYYSALQLQTQSADYIAEVSENLASVETVELDQSTTAITLVYELYGDTENLADFLKRNTIKDPFFIPADTPLEVLTGGN